MMNNSDTQFDNCELVMKYNVHNQILFLTTIYYEI